MSDFLEILGFHADDADDRCMISTSAAIRMASVQIECLCAKNARLVEALKEVNRVISLAGVIESGSGIHTLICAAIRSAEGNG